MSTGRLAFDQEMGDFVELLQDCTRILGIVKEPYYKTVVYHEPDTLGCLITTYIGPSIHHLGFCTTTLGHDPNLTKQTAARNALRRLCHIYE